jgi:hypothetical protein
LSALRITELITLCQSTVIHKLTSSSPSVLILN